MTPHDHLHGVFTRAIQTTFEVTPESLIFELPKDKSHGDLACTVAFTLAKPLKKAPRAIAEAITAAISPDAVIAGLEVAGPGFINITLAKASLYDVIPSILKDPDAFTTLETGRGQKVLLEYVSVNPTGHMHIGHARGAASGDTLARLLKQTGFDVLKEYYVNDAGNQMTKLAESLYVRYLEALGQPAEMPEDGYFGPDITALGHAIAESDQAQWVDHPERLKVFREKGLETLLAAIKTDLDRAGVQFDSFYHETSLYQDGHVADVLARLKASGYTYEKDGALYLKTSEKGDEKDRVLVKSSGDYTYILPDIAYHEQKFKRGYTHLIDILGTDHHGYIARLKASLEILGYAPEALEVLLIQLVRVIRDGVEVKMSKRSGKSLSLRDLLDDVGPNPIRYFFAARSLNTHMDLDLNLAEKQRNENPVFYVQYAHARIASLIKKAEDLGYDVTTSPMTSDTLNMPAITPLLNHLRQYPDMLEKAALSRDIHKIPNYLHELATLFHRWYAEEKLITDDRAYSLERISVLKAIRTLLRNGLSLIGVDAPDVM